MHKIDDAFEELLDSLSVFELAKLSFALRQNPEDKEHLHRVLIKIGEKGKIKDAQD